MIPPPNYMYQPAHGGSNIPLNRNGYLYPRHYYQFPPVNVPPMQVCYDYPPPSAVSTVRGPHQANFSKSSSPVSWPPRTFQINPRNQPPNTNVKQRHPTPPRYRSPSDPSYPFAQSWNNWNMYQMSPHNMYANYNYSPGMVPSFYPESNMGRSYQGHGTKSKHSTVNRYQDQSKSQMPVPMQSTTPNKVDPVVKSVKSSSTNTPANSSSENDIVLDRNNDKPSSSKSAEACIVSTTVVDKLSTVATQSAVKNNYTSLKTVSSPTQFQSSASEKVYDLKFIPENKMKPDRGVQIVPKFQSPLPPFSTQQPHSANTNPQTVLATNSKGSSKNESTKTIDVSSLSNVLENTTIKEKKSAAVPNDVTEGKPAPNPDYTPQSSKIPLQYEANTTKGLEVKGATAIAGAAAMRPISTPVTTTVYNTQSSKYYKGRPIQSQPRTIRDGNLNISYNNRKPAGLVPTFNDPGREHSNKSHSKVPNNGQQYYTMSYDNGANARAYNTQTYYVHQPQTSQPMSGYSSVPRPYIPQQHVVQSPEYQQVYQQPAEFVYYPSSSQTFYTTTPMLMQPQVLAYHPPKVSCYNCGGQNHTGAECTELTMEEITNKGLYENHYGPTMPDGRPRN